MLFQSLFDVLPALALLGMGLSGLEAVPSVSAHNAPPARAHHRHLAERAKLASNVGAKAKRAGQISVIRRADGKACRVRGESRTTAVLQSTSAAVIVTSVAPSTTEVAVVAVETSVGVPASNTWTTPSSAVPEAPAAAESSAAPAPAPSAEPAYTPSTYSGGGSGWANTGSKLGMAWPNGDWAQASDPNYVKNYIGSKASWYYTWSPFSVGSADSNGLEFVPMLWGPHQVSDFWAQQANWPNTVKNALFFNEPNEHSQCNVAASDSVSYWMNDFLPLRQKGIALGAAATTSAPSGLVWNRDAISACIGAGNSKADCTPDFIPLHWYDVSADNFIKYVESFHNEFGIDLWITEYACQNFNGGAQCDEGQVWNLHQTMSAWFDKTDYVKRYSPFGVMQNMQGVNQMNALMNPSGSITPLGNWYIASS